MNEIDENFQLMEYGKLSSDKIAQMNAEERQWYLNRLRDIERMNKECEYAETISTKEVRLVLMIDPAGNYHAVGGDREPGEGDMPFIGLERLRKVGKLK